MEEIYNNFTDIDDTQADTKFLATLDEDNIADTTVVDVSKNTPYSCNSEMEQQQLRQQQRLNDLAAQIDDIYDELPTTKSGKLLKQYVKSEGFGSHLVAIFDEWFMRSMKDNIQSRILTFNDGNYVSFENLRVDFPRYGPNKIRLTPKFAREQGITYGCDLYVSPILRDSKGVQLGKGEEYFIGNVPIMLKSHYCILHGKNAQELALFGEDPNDPDGIFIIDGVEKVIQGQEQLATDKILLMDTGEAVDVRMTASTATRGTILLKIMPDKDGVIEMSLPNMKAPKEEAKNLNVLRIFRLLVDIENERVEGQPFDDDLDVFADEDQMKDSIEAYFSRFIKEEYRDKCLLKLTRSFVDLFIISDDKGVVAKNMGKQTITNEEILKVFDTDVFPQVNNMPLPDNITEDRRRRLVIMAKLNLLSIMTARMLEYLAGFRQVNDRDSWSNKRVESSGRMMEGILRKAWKKALGLVEDSASKISSRNWMSEVKKIKPEIITMSFHDSFITNNWGVKGSPMKNNVAQTLNRDSVVASYAHVNLIDVGISRTDRSQKPRLVQMSQFGLVSAVKTPEGVGCGILKNINILTKYTLVRSDSNIIRYLLGDEGLKRKNWVDITYIPDSPRRDFIMVGGKFIGWGDGEEVQQELINKRRQGAFCYDMAVVKEDNFIYVDVSPSRPIWPLLVVDIDSQRLIIDILDMRNASNYELLTSGCVEYMSAWEQEYIKLAINEEKITERLNAIDEARKKKFEMEALLVNVQRNGPQLVRDTLVDENEAKQRIEEADKDLQKAEKVRAYTHCIIDGLATLDVAAALIPWPNHNQAPRNSYQAAMGAQALGVYHSNHLNRMLDGKTKLLAFPNRPMVSTDMYDVIGLDNKGPGENVIQAFMAFPYTEEDAFVVKKEFLDNGGFRIYKYLTYKTIINESNSEFDEFLCHPNDAGGRQLRSDNLHRYRHIQRGGEGNPMTGLPQIGAPLFAGDAIIGKVQRSKVGEERGKIRDESVIMRVGDEGVVEKVTVTSYKNKKTVIVKLRVMRVPEAGDKFAPRNAQKGTIGLVMSDIDLPFSTTTGITPDFIMNPASMPSRMTLSYPMEIQSSKAAAMSGVRINGGAFHKNMLDEHRRTLKRYGMHEFGYEEMRSGTSAEPLEALIASGPLFVQALKHHVKDKIQARGTGPVNPATRQGTRGRSARGGLRSKSRPLWKIKFLQVPITRGNTFKFREHPN